MIPYYSRLLLASIVVPVTLALLSGNGLAEGDKLRFEFENTKNQQKKPPPIKYQDLYNALQKDNRQYQADNQVIHEGPTSISPVLPGMRIADFTVTNVTGKELKFDAKSLARPLVITFYRGGWCPYCNMHLAQLRFAEKELLEMGFDVWFVSPDRVEMLRESLEDPEVQYTLLSDSHMQAALAFGVAYEVSRKDLDKYYNGGLVLREASGQAHNYLPVPGTFIVGTDGLVYFQYVNPNYKTQLDPELLLAAAKSYLRQTEN